MRPSTALWTRVLIVTLFCMMRTGVTPAAMKDASLWSRPRGPVAMRTHSPRIVDADTDQAESEAAPQFDRAHRIASGNTAWISTPLRSGMTLSNEVLPTESPQCCWSETTRPCRE